MDTSLIWRTASNEGQSRAYVATTDTLKYRLVQTPAKRWTVSARAYDESRGFGYGEPSFCAGDFKKIDEAKEAAERNESRIATQAAL